MIAAMAVANGTEIEMGLLKLASNVAKESSTTLFRIAQIRQATTAAATTALKRSLRFKGQGRSSSNWGSITSLLIVGELPIEGSKSQRNPARRCEGNHRWYSARTSPNLHNMTFPVTMTWPEEWGVDADAFKSTPDLLGALTRKFGEMQQQFSQAIAQHQLNLPNLLAVMVGQSWYPDFELPMAEARALEARAIAGDVAAIDLSLSEYFRANADYVEQRISRRYAARGPILAEAFKAYRAGNYVLAIPVFLAQADGISKTFLNENFFRFFQSLPHAQQLLLDNQINDYVKLLLAPLVQQGTIRVHTSTLQGQTGYLNRHAIMHGGDLAYGTEINALKCISLLAYVWSVDLNTK